jgi:hypothetical protein
LRHFIETGRPGYFKQTAEIQEGFDEAALKAHMERLDMFELWRLPWRCCRTPEKTYGANGSADTITRTAHETTPMNGHMPATGSESRSLRASEARVNNSSF